MARAGPALHLRAGGGTITRPRHRRFRKSFAACHACSVLWPGRHHPMEATPRPGRSR
jgi:hypothetical protein